MNSSRIYSSSTSRRRSSKLNLVHADAAAADPVPWKGSRVSPELRSTAHRQKYKQEVVSVMMFFCQSPALWGRSHLWQSAGPYLRPALPSVLHQIAMVITRPRNFLFFNLMSHSISSSHHVTRSQLRILDTASMVNTPLHSVTRSPGFERLTCFSCLSQSSGLLELHSLTRHLDAHPATPPSLHSFMSPPKATDQ